MGLRPSLLHSIERRKNNLGYSKDNCYWATKEEQSKNRRYTVWLECEFGKITQHELALKLQVNDASISYHLKKGLSVNGIIQHFKNYKYGRQ